jgi:hypothetical protein
MGTPGVLNLALRVLNLVVRVLNLVPGTQYLVLYTKNPIENFQRQKSHPRQKPPPPPDSGLGEHPNLLVYFRRPYTKSSNRKEKKRNTRVQKKLDVARYMYGI